MSAFTYFQQFEEMDCGAACLRMVAYAHGREYSLEDLRERSGLSRAGVSLLGISEAAESIGLQTLAVTASPSQIEEALPLPCILPWRDDHFVVLHAVERGVFSIADPDAVVGMVDLTQADFLAGWSDERDEEGQAVGKVLVLEATPAFHASRETKGEQQGYQYVLRYILGYRGLMTNLGAGLLLALLLQLAMPFLLKNLVDFGIVLNDPNFIAIVIVAQGVLLVTTTLLAGLRRYILIHIGGRVNVSLVSDYISKLVRLPMEFFDSRSRGDIFQRIYDHERLQEFLTGSTLLRVFNLINFLAFALVLLLWDFTLFAIFLVGTLANFAWVGYLQGRKRFLNQAYFGQSAANNEQLMEIIDGIAEIKQNNAGQQRRWAWERNRAKLYRTTLELNNLDQYQRTVGSLINQGKNLVITLVAALAVVEGTLSIGALVAIHYILAQLNSPIEDLSEFFRDYQENLLGLERINEIHNKQDEQPDAGRRMRLIPETGKLELVDVSFKYTMPNAPWVLRNVSVEIPVGKITAIVGASGSGKSTLLKLLLGFYPPESGELLLGGTKLSTIDHRFWRAHVGMVSQDGYLFSDTIARNIVLGEERIDQERLLTAVKVAQIERFIDGLSEGYHTRIGESGMGLSKGQQQRILIARAIYHRPRYLFLDEATTGLDAFTEVTIMDNLFTYMQGATILIVAHRYTTFERADHILVIDEGQIVERGSHNDLMADRSNYFRMVRNQTLLGS